MVALELGDSEPLPVMLGEPVADDDIVAGSVPEGL